jgi:hypothetical protein
MAADEPVGVGKGGGQRVGVGDGEGHADVVADFEPDEVDERQAERAFELIGGVEDELAIGGREDARDRIADLSGEFVPGVTGREPVGEIKVGLEVRKALCFRGAVVEFRGGSGGCVGIGGGLRDLSLVAVFS